MMFLGGASRSGKSTLARQFAPQLGLTHLATDTFTAALRALPALNMATSATPGSNNTHITQPFWHAAVKKWLETDQAAWLLEGRAVTPKLVKAVEETTGRSFKAAFMGYPNSTVEAKLAQMHAFSHLPDAWVIKRDATFQRAWIEENISLSQTLQQECDTLGYKFFDVSHEFDQPAQSMLDYFKG